MFASTWMPAATYASKGGPGVQASSQIDTPTEEVPTVAMQPAPPGMK